MRKTFFISLITALVFCTVGAVMLFSGVAKGLEHSVPQSNTSLYEGWKVGDYNGYLALFRGNGANPEEVYEIPVSALREYDRRLIMGGLYIDDYDAAKKFIEELSG